MDGPGISDISDEARKIDGDALDEVIRKSVEGDENALSILLYCEWLWNVLTRISNNAARQFRVDADDLLDYVFDQLRRKIQSIKNPNGSKWRDCLAGFCRTTAHYRCINLMRPRRQDEAYRDSVVGERTGWRRHGQRIDEPCSTEKSPEEEVEQHEQDSIREGATPRISETVWRVFNSLKPEDATLILLWVDGKTLKQISDETRIPLSSVARRLAELQKVFFKEIIKVGVEEIGEAMAEETGVTQIPEHVKEHRAGLRELIARSLREMARAGHAPLAGV